MTASSDTVAVTISPRMFVALIGAVAAVVGAVALLLPIQVSTPDGFGYATHDCGSTIAPSSSTWDPIRQFVCDDAIDTRRAWGWPVAVVGVVAVAGAALVRTPAET